jgi:hypothetical protein
MLDRTPPVHKYSTVVATVFDSFLAELRDQQVVDAATIKRLETSLTQGEFSVDKLRTALFSEDPLQ